jgi:cysteine desulfurase/selenocysteine lyase
MEQVRSHELKLTERAMELMAGVPKLRLVGPENPKDGCGLISFTLADVHPHDLAEFLDAKFRIAVRAGHHCAVPLHTKLGLTATTRASFYIYNTEEEVEVLARALRESLTYFRVS